MPSVCFIAVFLFAVWRELGKADQRVWTAPLSLLPLFRPDNNQQWHWSNHSHTRTVAGTNTLLTAVDPCLVGLLSQARVCPKQRRKTRPVFIMAPPQKDTTNSWRPRLGFFAAWRLWVHFLLLLKKGLEFFTCLVTQSHPECVHQPVTQQLFEPSLNLFLPFEPKIVVVSSRIAKIPRRYVQEKLWFSSPAWTRFYFQKQCLNWKNMFWEVSMSKASLILSFVFFWPYWGLGGH